MNILQRKDKPISSVPERDKEKIYVFSIFRSPFLNKISKRISNLVLPGKKTGWVKGIIQGYRYSFKAYEKPSKHGIEGSEISKLELWKDNELLVNYDRGWDLRPDSKELKSIINALLKDNGYQLTIN